MVHEGVEMNNEHIDAVATILKSMSHPIRLKILYMLLEGDKTTGQLLEEIKTTNPNMSQHLNVLRDSGVIQSKKERTFVHNSIADKRIAQVLKDIQQLFHPGDV